MTPTSASPTLLIQSLIFLLSFSHNTLGRTFFIRGSSPNCGSRSGRTASRRNQSFGAIHFELWRQNGRIVSRVRPHLCLCRLVNFGMSVSHNAYFGSDRGSATGVYGKFTPDFGMLCAFSYSLFDSGPVFSPSRLAHSKNLSSLIRASSRTIPVSLTLPAARTAKLAFVPTLTLLAVPSIRVAPATPRETVAPLTASPTRPLQNTAPTRILREDLVL